MERHRPGYGFLLPWSAERGGGVTHVVVALLKECAADDKWRPVLLEADWAAGRAESDESGDNLRIRLRLTSPYGRQTILSTLLFLASMPGELYRLRQLIQSHDLRVINMHFPGLESFNLVVLRRLGLFRGNTVLTFHGSDVRHILRTRGIERVLWRLMLRGVDRLVFVSEDLRTEFLPFNPALASRSIVIHNGIDIQAFTNNSTQNPPLAVPLSHRVVVSVGQFEYRKGHDLLLRAFEMVLAERPDTSLIIVGSSGPTLADIRRLIDEMHLTAKVTLITDIPHNLVPPILNRADVFVLSSRWRKGEYGEGFPLVLAEAGAFGLPVVATASTGCGEIIFDGETGRLVALEDPASLANAITGLLRDRESAQTMGANLRTLLREKFSWQHAWVKYRNLGNAS